MRRGCHEDRSPQRNVSPTNGGSRSCRPAFLPLAKAGLEVLVEQGAGLVGGLARRPVRQQRGADRRRPGRTVSSGHPVAGADVRSQPAGRPCGPPAPDTPIASSIGTCDPLGAPEAVREMAQTGASVFALELIPRITRAQSMDVLSSQATIAGYRAVLLAATELPKMFPMLMTAAGTLAAARVFIIGAGVAGLQAIATARRLGAIVQAYDVRAATREQVESLGGKFVELKLEAGEAEDKGRLCEGAGRGVLSAAARTAGQRRRPKRCGHHHGRDSGTTVAAVGDRHGRRGDGGRQRDRGSGGGTRRQLRTESSRINAWCGTAW